MPGSLKLFRRKKNKPQTPYGILGPSNWNPATSCSGNTYNGNYVKAAMANNCNARGSVGVQPGTRGYFELTWTVYTHPYLVLGFGSIDAPLNYWNAGSDGAYIYGSNGSTAGCTTLQVGNYATTPFGVNAVIGVGIDLIKMTASIFVNGILNDVVIGLPNKVMYPMAAYMHGNGVTLNTGGPFVYNPSF